MTPTPEQIALLKWATLLIEQIGSWNFAMIFLVAMLAPWLFLWVWSSGQSRRDKERDEQFQAQVQMYKDNVELVRRYDESVNRWEKHSDALAETIYLNTQAMTRVVDRLEIAERNRR